MRKVGNSLQNHILQKTWGWALTIQHSEAPMEIVCKQYQKAVLGVWILRLHEQRFLGLASSIEETPATFHLSLLLQHVLHLLWEGGPDSPVRSKM